MDRQRIELDWKGPFKWADAQGNGILKIPEGQLCGVYLWTVSYEDSYLTYYVGETTRSFSQRFEEHAKEYLSGTYRICDPVLLMNGQKELIWEGLWKKGTRDRLDLFISRLPELSLKIQQLLSTFSIFIIPMKREKRVIQRVEAAIANHLLKQNGVIDSFQDDDIRYLPRRDGEVYLNHEETRSNFLC